MMEEDISLTAYEFKGYEDSIRASLEQTGLFGEGNQKLWEYFSDEIQQPNIRSLSLDVESPMEVGFGVCCRQNRLRK